MAKKLAIRALQRGVGSMDFVDMLLIMEDPDESSEESSHAPLATPLDRSEPSIERSSIVNQATPWPQIQQQLTLDQLLHWKIHQSLFLSGVNVDSVEPCHKRLKTNVAI